MDESYARRAKRIHEVAVSVAHRLLSVAPNENYERLPPDRRRALFEPSLQAVDRDCSDALTSKQASDAEPNRISLQPSIRERCNLNMVFEHVAATSPMWVVAITSNHSNKINKYLINTLCFGKAKPEIYPGRYGRRDRAYTRERKGRNGDNA